MVRMFQLILAVIIMAGCAAGALSGEEARSKDVPMVLNKTWQWVSTVTPVEKITAPDPEHYTIQLIEGGKARVRFDCNSGGGNYIISKGKVSFGPLMSTRMACPEGSMDSAFMRDLQRVSSFFLESGELFLELSADSGTMRFRPEN